MVDVPGVDAEFVEAIRKLSVGAAGHFTFHNLAAPAEMNGVPETIPVALRAGEKTEILNLKPHFDIWRVAPERRIGTASATTLASFCDLVNRHKDDGSVIFAETAWPNPKLTAILDYHGLDNTPRFGAHRVEYAFPLTDELKTWIELDGKPQPQGEFARFLEDHAAELASPDDHEREMLEPLFKERFADPNELIALSRDLEIVVGSKLKRSERLKSGERVIQFEEVHKDGTGQEIKIPGIFMVALRPFIDGNEMRVPARLRYKVAGADVNWSFQLYRWREWLRRHVQAALEDAKTATELPAFEGRPEKA